jgi:hypothetical protein
MKTKEYTKMPKHVVKTVFKKGPLCSSVDHDVANKP